jgi:Iap family predicted aminopeptidase
VSGAPTFRRRAVMLGAVGVLGGVAAPMLRARASQALVSPFGEADIATAQRLRELALRDTRAYALVDSLVKQIGPRAAGSPAYDRAVQWALAQFGQLGFANVRTEPVSLQMWRRAETSVELVEPETRPLIAVALGNSVGTQGRPLEAEIAYYPDFDTLKADTSDRARGRIVFIDQRMQRTGDESGYGKAVRARSAGAVEAAKRGAIAHVIRSIGTDHDPVAHTGMMRYTPDVAQIPSLAVSVPDAERIAALHAAGRTVRLRVRMQDTARVPATAHNVIAEVPGTDLAHEIVLLGAHLDSWDIAPGALDDGAGVGIVTAAARTLIDAGVKPRRTVRVVLFANEENGLDGAKAYAAQYKGVTHQLVGESDLGADRILHVRMQAGPQAAEAVGAMAGLLRPLGIEGKSGEASPSPDASVVSDLLKCPSIELAQDANRYFDVHHTVNDTMDRIDPATVPQNVAAWATVAWLAAQSRVPFGLAAT